MGTVLVVSGLIGTYGTGEETFDGGFGTVKSDPYNVSTTFWSGRPFVRK